MTGYRLAPGAETDLLEIAIYTIETWGEAQAARYERSLATCFRAIGNGEARSAPLLDRRPELRHCRCQHHYVFWLDTSPEPPLILAVLHESMDLVSRIRSRLDS